MELGIGGCFFVRSERYMGTHELYMRRAIELAQNGAGLVSPNPMVGCVIVHSDRIIAEGWHKIFGGPHAEVEAINAVSDRHLLADSTLYVCLEPCSHHGKTPPCADLVINSGIRSVVVGTGDPNPLVNGRGIARMQEAGIMVTTGILEQDCRLLNRRFITRITKNRPWIMLKWAATADGFIARTDGSSKWISNEQSRQLVHRLRSTEDVVLVGAGTAATDDPALIVRDWHGRNPVRVVIDPSLKLPYTLKLFDGSETTIRYNLLQDTVSGKVITVKLPKDDFLPALLKDLYARNIGSVLVEGGTRTIQSFIDAGLWDEAWRFTAPVNFSEGIREPSFESEAVTTEDIGGDRLEIFRNPESASL